MNAKTPFTLSHETPASMEYRELRSLAGLSSKTEEAALRGLPNTLFAATLRKGDKLVAMGRVVGDGGCNFEIVDVAVHPDYRRRGLGSRIMTSIMAYIKDNAPASAYVSLIADHHSPALYSKFGFQPVSPKSIGMALRITQ